MDFEEARAALTQKERLERGKTIIQQNKGLQSVRPFRKDGYINVLNKYGTSRDNSEAYEFAAEPVVPDTSLTIQYEDNGLFAKIIDTPAEEAVKHCDLPGYRKRAVALLDEQMGAVPDSFLYRGRSYTARSFADSLRFKAEDYVQLTSFTHHPFYTPFILEVPDNWEHQCYFNLPLDELEQVVRRALSAGKTVAWHGDVSEDTFSPRQGMALWTQHPVTQEMRQHEFERFLTTDDHMMHLIGTAHDEAGRFYYLLKNSYGRYGAYAGLLYMSEDYFRAKTVSVLLRK